MKKYLYFFFICFLCLYCTDRDHSLDLNNLPYGFNCKKLLNNEYFIIEFYDDDLQVQWKIFKHNSNIILNDLKFEANITAIIFNPKLRHVYNPTDGLISNVWLTSIDDSVFKNICRELKTDTFFFQGSKGTVETYINRKHKNIRVNIDSTNFSANFNVFAPEINLNKDEILNFKIFIPKREYYILSSYQFEKKKKILYKVTKNDRIEIIDVPSEIGIDPYIPTNDTLKLFLHYPKSDKLFDSTIVLPIGRIDLL